MNTIIKFLSVIIMTIWIFEVNAEETYLIRINNPDSGLITQFLEEGRDIASYIPGKRIDIVTTESGLNTLSQKYKSITVLETSSGMRLKKSSSSEHYQTYDSMLEKLKQFEKTYPGLCKLYDIGDSRGKEYTKSAYSTYKHEIWAMKVTGNIDKKADKPKIYFMGEHHAREPASLEVCMAILENFLTKYASDSVIAERVNNCEIWFVPLVNPNGHRLTQVKPTANMWRKNIRDNNNDGKIDIDPMGGCKGDGVDLNRNYDYKWGTTGTTKDSLDELYCGPSASSEPEIIAVKTLLNQNLFVTGISYHLYSELVIWPYAFEKDANAPDSAALGDLGRKIAVKLEKAMEGEGTYKPIKASDLYPCSGNLEDYAYSTYGTFAYTIELYDGSFFPDAKAVEKLENDNIIASMELVKRLTYSSLTGTVTSGAGNIPVEAEIFIKEIEDTVATKTSWRGAYKTEKEYGRYYRLLLPGKYTVTVKPKDPTFKDTTFAGVEIFDNKLTTLNVSYEASSILSMNGKPDQNGIYMEKAPGGFVRLALPAGDQLLQARVFSAEGKVIRELFPTQFRNISEWNTNGMANGLYYINVKGAKHSGIVRLVVAR